MRLGTTDRPLAARLALAGTAGLVVGRATYQMVPHFAAEVALVLGLAAVGVWLLVTWRRVFPLPPRSNDTERRLVPGFGSYTFCRPTHGYRLASVVGLVTAMIGISSAGIQISALMLRCRIPAKIAVGTGTAAASITLAIGSLIVAAAGEVDWAVATVAVPAAVLDSLMARNLARGVPTRGLGVGARRPDSGSGSRADENGDLAVTRRHLMRVAAT